MSKTLEYKGYRGSIEFDLEDKCLFGKALFLSDAVIYQGNDLSELEKCFQSAIDDYLDTCAEIGKNPEKPFSGSLNVRMPQEMHKRLAYRAADLGININTAINKSIACFLADQPVQTHNHVHDQNYQVSREDRV